MRSLGIVGGIAAGYGAAAELANIVRPSDANPTFVPTAGISIAALVLLDRRRWPVALLAMAAIGIVVDLGRGLTMADAALLAVAATTQALVAAGLLRRLAPDVSVAHNRDIAGFALAAMVVGPALGAALATPAYARLQGLPWYEGFLNWWVGNAVGALVVGATIIAWQRSSSTVPRRPWWEWLVVLGGIGVLTAPHAVLDTGAPTFQLAFLPVPLLLWAALRLGERGLLNAGSILAVVACLPASWGYGLWAPPEDESAIGPSLRIFLLVAVLAGWLITVEVGGRERAEQGRQTQQEIATRLQRALLPGALPTVPGVAAVARYRTGDDLLSIGGDWYDLAARPDGRLVAVVGDVVGHDLAAAAVMGRLRSALAAIALDAADPAEALYRLERFAGSQTPASVATVAYLELDPATGLLRYACAGHPPPLVLPPDGGEPVFLTGGRSLPLFATGNGSRPTGETKLAPGSVVVCYTDGLVERRESSFVVGLERLRDAAGAARGEPLDQLADDTLRRLTAGRRLTDDVALLCLRLTAEREPYPVNVTFMAPAVAARATGVAGLAGPGGLAGPARPGGLAESARPGGLAEPARPSGPAGSARPSGPAGSAESVVATESAESVVTAGPAQPAVRRHRQGPPAPRTPRSRRH